MNYQNPVQPRMKMSDLEAVLRRLAIQPPIVVKLAGRVTYSHIKTQIEGAELAEANARKIQRGGKADNRPYYSFNIGDAVVIPDAKLPPEVQAFFEQRIVHKIHEDGTQSHVFYATSKSPFPADISWGPNSGVTDPTTMPRNAGELENELAAGVPVIIGVKIFSSPQGLGTGLDFVIIDGPVRYFNPQGRGTNADMEEALRAMGAAAPAPTTAPVQPPQNAPVPTPPVAPQAVDPMGGGQPVSPTPPANPFMAPPAGDPAYGGPQYPGMGYTRT